MCQSDVLGEAVQTTRLPLVAECTRKNGLRYDALASGPTVYGYANGNPINLIDPLGLASCWLFDCPSLPQGVVNSAAGFGDGVSSILTLGNYSTSDYRLSHGIDGGVDQCAASYLGGKYAGYVWGVGTWWAAGLNGGANSMFWAGNGARSLAAAAGTTIDQTLIGSMLDAMGPAVHPVVWQAASATFAMNAAEGSGAVLLYVAPTSIWNMESAILAWRGISVL